MAASGCDIPGAHGQQRGSCQGRSIDSYGDYRLPGAGTLSPTLARFRARNQLASDHARDHVAGVDPWKVIRDRLPDAAEGQENAAQHDLREGSADADADAYGRRAEISANA